MAATIIEIIIDALRTNNKLSIHSVSESGDIDDETSCDISFIDELVTYKPGTNACDGGPVDPYIPDIFDEIYSDARLLRLIFKKIKDVIRCRSNYNL